MSNIERDYAKLAAAVRRYADAVATDRDAPVRRAEVSEKITALAEQHRGAVLRADVLERALTMACGSADVRESCIRQAQAEQDRARIDAGGQ